MNSAEQQKKTTLWGGLTILLAVGIAGLAWSEIAAALSRCFLLF